MNERIEEFAKQCYVKTGSPHTDYFEYWKFAELIVRECVEQIQICSEQIKNDDGYADDHIWPIMQSIVDAVAIDVKEHFGDES